jgi:hypothetical protein
MFFVKVHHGMITTLITIYDVLAIHVLVHSFIPALFIEKDEQPLKQKYQYLIH